MSLGQSRVIETSDSFSIRFEASQDERQPSPTTTDLEAEAQRARQFTTRVRQLSSTTSDSVTVESLDGLPTRRSLSELPHGVVSLQRTTSLPSMVPPPPPPPPLPRRHDDPLPRHAKSLDQGNVIIVLLLEKLCALAVPKPTQARTMLKTIVTRLASLGILNEIPLEETAGIRSMYGEAFTYLLEEAQLALELSRSARTSVSPSTSMSLVPVRSMHDLQASDNVAIERSRYMTEFTELDHLGRGGFGSVVKARSIIDGGEYAIKKIPLAKSLGSKVLREVTTLARLNHPRIVRYHTAWFEKGPGSHASSAELDEGSENPAYLPGPVVTLYIQMELCQATLFDYLRARKQVEPRVSLSIFHQLLEAVGYVHDQGLLHRDLKPQNIFLKPTEDGFDVRLGDFGLARAAEASDRLPVPSDTTIANRVLHPDQALSSGIGTATYAAPEQLQGHDYGNKCDIYAMGIILFELFCLFSTDMERHESIHLLKQQQQVPPSFVQPYPFVSMFCLHMTAHDPCLRPSLPDLLHGELASVAKSLVARPTDHFKVLSTLPDGRQLEYATPMTTCATSSDVTTAEPATLAEAKEVIAQLKAIVAQQQAELLVYKRLDVNNTVHNTGS
eukprot:m.292981 g.292981  ORF g.292981 m.292981 type:complete len:615 (-) comp17868_c0_seq1:55-1899(-)